MQKIKMLKIFELLICESSFNNPLTTNYIISVLHNYGISCDRRTLYKDMEFFSLCGYDVHKIKVSHSNAYYIVK